MAGEGPSDDDAAGTGETRDIDDSLLQEALGMSVRRIYRLDQGSTVVQVGGAEPLVAPILVVNGAGPAAEVRLAGVVQVEGVDISTSYDAAEDALWISFRSTWLGDVPLDVE